MPPHDVITGRGGPDSLWPIWNQSKRISLNLRAHLSALFALVIVVIMITREFGELKDVVREPRWLLFFVLAVGSLFSARYLWLLYVPVKLRVRIHVLYSVVIAATVLTAFVFGPTLYALYKASPFRLLVLTLAVATVAEALWEVFGDKLSSSHRDIWFSVAMREAIRQFDEVLTREQVMSETELAKWYGDFLDWLLKYSSTALCGRTEVQAAFLMRPPDREGVLRLFKTSPDCDYPSGLEVCLPGRGRTPGAAGLAFTMERPGVVYVPYRKKKQAWTFVWQPHLSYDMSDHSIEAWTEVKGQPWFESSLSVPVYFYDRENRATGRVAGILAFSSRSPDPFEPPDYLMAECFAHLLSQALFLKETMQGARRMPSDASAIDPNRQRKKKPR